MKFSKFQISLFTLLRLPSVWLCGIRVTLLEQSFCEAKVKHRWINQNPFNSMFWAVQGMAAELTTGMLLMQEIQTSKRKVSMLVLNNKANFSKKAQGRITFSCNSADLITNAIKKLLETDKPQTLWLTSKGIDENNDLVSTFEFEWTLLIKK
ncbi:MAG: DUF4442 domain-containing protein [Phycisphaerales bacterium]|nr:DUF4442 domain-containing protein [Phycisphaerales bacterium]CAI8250518.1 MAG: Uncharacterised protein [Cryomorphaceae bacterium]|tara:strand:+ start:270 stop:725 length:456 start_codon:yes stop_codon:yes gene_type:complete